MKVRKWCIVQQKYCMAKRILTDAEKSAIERKLEHPNEKVECPRCGKNITYAEIGNSIRVSCETDGCIFGGIRGI